MLTAKNITKSYATGAAGGKALDGVSLTIGKGDFACIVGRSGSGKSTLLNVLSTLLIPDSGELSFEGKPITGLGEKALNRLRSSDFSMVFQMRHLLPYLTALENALSPYLKSLRPVSAARREAALKILERVGLAGKKDRLPGELSGGEQQRVAIARALATSPKILFADEPTGSLDKRTGDAVMGILRELNRDGLTVVMVSHDPGYAASASRIIELQDGRILNAA